MRFRVLDERGIASVSSGKPKGGKRMFRTNNNWQLGALPL